MTTAKRAEKGPEKRAERAETMEEMTGTVEAKTVAAGQLTDCMPCTRFVQVASLCAKRALATWRPISKTKDIPANSKRMSFLAISLSGSVKVWLLFLLVS